MWYVIVGQDNPGSLEQRKANRPAHLQRLEVLRDLGRLQVAGTFPEIDDEDQGPAGFTGSLIIADFTDLESAKAWAGEDPYLLAGVYATVDVRPFRKVLP